MTLKEKKTPPAIVQPAAPEKAAPKKDKAHQARKWAGDVVLKLPKVPIKIGPPSDMLIELFCPACKRHVFVALVNPRICPLCNGKAQGPNGDYAKFPTSPVQFQAEQGRRRQEIKERGK